jgi:hypothetical protein
MPYGNGRFRPEAATRDRQRVAKYELLTLSTALHRVIVCFSPYFFAFDDMAT